MKENIEPLDITRINRLSLKYDIKYYMIIFKALS